MNVLHRFEFQKLCINLGQLWSKLHTHVGIDERTWLRLRSYILFGKKCAITGFRMVKKTLAELHLSSYIFTHLKDPKISLIIFPTANVPFPISNFTVVTAPWKLCSINWRGTGTPIFNLCPFLSYQKQFQFLATDCTWRIYLRYFEIKNQIDEETQANNMVKENVRKGTKVTNSIYVKSGT